MLFTAVPTKSNIAPPLQFRDEGNTTDIPARSSEVNVFSIPKGHSINYAIFKEYFWLACYTQSTKRDSVLVPQSEVVNALDSKRSVITFTPAPEVCLAFKSALNVVGNDAVKKMGYSQERFAGMPQYRGSFLGEHAEALVELGVKPYSPAPPGTVDWSGLAAYRIINKLVVFSLSALQDPNLSSEGKGIMLPVAPVATSSTGVPATISKVASATNALAFHGTTEVFCAYNKKGHHFSFRSKDLSSTDKAVLLPYFHGLLLPDCDFLFNNSVTLWSRLLGATAKDVEETIATLKRGCVSLSRTPAGMALAHLIQIILLALSAGTRPKVVWDGPSYGGAVLIGDASYFRGGSRYNANDGEKVLEEIRSRQSHEGSLKEICEILSSLPLQSDKDKKTTYSPEEMTSPRVLHRAITSVRVDKDAHIAISGHLPLLRYEQSFWKATDKKAIMKVVQAISKSTFLPDDAPIEYKTPVMFSNGTIDTALSAFGPRVPSFMATQGQPRTIEPFKTDKATDVLLNNKERGFPAIAVYVKNRNEAFEDWEAMKRRSLIYVHFTSDGKSAAGGPAVSFKGKERNEMFTHLQKAFGRVSEKGKRTRDDSSSEEEDLGDAARQKAKRAKLDKGAAEKIRLLSIMGVAKHHRGAESDSEMEL